MEIINTRPAKLPIYYCGPYALIRVFLCGSRRNWRGEMDVDNCEEIYLCFLITLGGGIRCDKGWSALCDVSRMLFLELLLLCVFRQRPGCHLWPSCRKTHKSSFQKWARHVAQRGPTVVATDSTTKSDQKTQNSTADHTH